MFTPLNHMHIAPASEAEEHHTMNMPCDRFQDCWKIVNKQQFDNSKQIIQQVSQKLGTLS